MCLKETPSLFSDIQCSRCKNYPGFNPDNPMLWFGFLDQDTGQHVCWNCQTRHYQIKQGLEPGTTFSEMPVVLQQQFIG